MLAWAREEGEVGSVKAQLPRLPRTLIDVLSRYEIDRLEDAAKSERDKLIVRTLADTGIRVGELVKLRAVDALERDRRCCATSPRWPASASACTRIYCVTASPRTSSRAA